MHLEITIKPPLRIKCCFIKIVRIVPIFDEGSLKNVYFLSVNFYLKDGNITRVSMKRVHLKQKHTCSLHVALKQITNPNPVFNKTNVQLMPKT